MEPLHPSPVADPRRRTLSALGLALAVTAAACGGGDGAEEPTASITAPTAEGGDDADGSGGESGDTAAADGGDGTAVTSSTTVAPPTIAESSTTVAPIVPVDLPQPTSAEAMADALSEAELAVRDTGATAEERAAWGRRQQQLYRILAGREVWVDQVLAEVDPAVSTAVAGNWAARVELDFLLRQHSLSDTLPAWRIDEPLPADELLGYYREAGERHGVPWEILAAINLIETRMGRINGISTAGAQGPMQFLPTTWAECCEGDPYNDRDAINGAAQYLIDRGGATDLDRAIWGYNNSDHYVGAVTGYAAVLAEDPEAYYGYHGWQVYFASTAGLALLPEGYEEAEPVDADAWLTDNPEALLTVEG
ncbi:MAG: lytic transglycosylase domain-containing protein [Actinomycetota bacterium]